MGHVLLLEPVTDKHAFSLDKLRLGFEACVKNALRLLALMDPVYGALLLLGEGLLDLRHAQRLSHADEESQRKYAEEALASAESEIEEAAHLVSAMEKGR